MLKHALRGAAIGVAACCATHATAGQIVLTPLAVFGSSGDYSGIYAASNILDQQTGAIFESSQDGSYWLAPDNGPTDAFISMDLGASYRITSFDLFNTHNAFVNDRGTGAFSIVGSNSATFDVVATLVSGTLAAQTIANDPLDAQSFAVANPGGFRYLQFRPTGVASGQAICCGITRNWGLNELRVYGDLSVAPEPGAWALMILGFGAAGASLRRRIPRAASL